MRLLGFISLRSARLLLQKQKTPVLKTAASGEGTTGEDLGLNKSRSTRLKSPWPCGPSPFGKGDFNFAALVKGRCRHCGGGIRIRPNNIVP